MLLDRAAWRVEPGDSQQQECPIPPQSFYNDDRGYLAWRQRHPSGYVVNVDESEPTGTRLHRTSCSYLQRPIDEGLNLTGAYPKVCATRVEELGPYWKGGHRCGRCLP